MIPTINTVQTTGDLFLTMVLIVVWSFASWGFGTILFRSLFAILLLSPIKKKQAWIASQKRLRLDRAKAIHLMTWELENNEKYNPKRKRGKELIKKEPLNEEEKAKREETIKRFKELNDGRIISKGKWYSMVFVDFFFSCVFCHQAWLMILLLAIYSEFSSFWLDLFPSAVGYSVLQCLLFVKREVAENKGVDVKEEVTASCPSCRKFLEGEKSDR